MKDLAQFFKALSDETRLQIVALLLMKEELCVCDIENTLNMTQSKASRHLRYLMNSGILTDTRKNIWVYYSISKSLNSNELAVLDALKKCLGSDVRIELKKKLDGWMKSKEESNVCKL
ncbi:MAG TPA: metalloregulator ArsR/SmtB family transcription factor [bacterium]|nr:metalloregulator ArsR/SmtB family transcription factor [bacterium]HQN73008.1 metalloregulator ArsR/SmtB family transcription factor [bacterium]HQO92720.1 metalloregulator ArsR/SmtB family transcription factor [bacterium]